nr:reverse transcriptase domain-containing protein [Tanacetum cinerariifolium]
MAKINKNLMRVLQVNQQVKAVTPNCETCGVLIPSLIVQPPLATLKTYMLREPIKWEHLPLAVGNYTASGNSLRAVGMPCAFYSQQIHDELAKFRSNHDPVLVVSLAGRTVQDAEKFEQWVDLLHLFQTPDVRVPLSDMYGNTLHWQWELILPVETLSWQWECLVHFIPNMLRKPTKGNNQGRKQFFQGDNQCQNQPPAYQAPAYQASVYQASVHQPQIPQPQVVTTNEFTNFMKTNDSILKNMQTNMTSLKNSNHELKNMFGQFMKMNTALSLGLRTLPGNTITNPKEDLKVISPIIELVASPVSAPKPHLRPSIPYTSRLQDQKLRDKVNDQREKFFQIFKDLNFNISFADALILMPNGSSKKLPEKLGDLDKFLIPCDFPRMAECLALADLGVNINLMPLSVWNNLSLPDLSHTCMTLELVDRLISHPVRVAEDVFVKVGTFHFPADFIVIDFDDDPRVPLILERSFLKTERDLIDVFEGELTLRVGKEAITFNLDQTSRYSANYNDMMTKRIVVIDMACEEYSQEVLSFSDVIASGNPTPYHDPIVSTTSPTLTPFENSDFLLEEVDAFLALEDDLTLPEVDQSFLDSEGDILLLEAFLNDDPSLPPPNQGNYLPEVRKELKICEAKSDKSSIDEPTEKTALIMVLKSHKRAIAWKLSDIKGINLEFCTHKILMEEDFEPTVQHQRRVNPKIHDVIKQEVLKLLNAGLIYPISDSPWVSPVHCVPKMGGFTVVENKENELILTRLVMGWHVCIDYRKLNEATRKDHFPLPFMDQMLERLARNQYYCFLDGFFGFIKDFSKIARLMTRLLEKDTPFIFSKECVKAFQTLKRKLTEAPILIAPAWDMPFELMCDASDFAIGAVLGQRQEKYFRPIHYASKTMTEAESNYTTTEKEMLAVVYAFENF